MPTNERASGRTSGEESAQEVAEEQDGPLEQSKGLDIDRKRAFRTPGFSRIRTDWTPEEASVFAMAKNWADKKLSAEFPDAFRILAKVQAKVRTPLTDQETGEVFKDSHGLPRWVTDEWGVPVEDWDQLTHKEKDDLLYQIVTKLFAWEQRSQDAWHDAMLSRGVWEEMYAIKYDEPGSGTMGEREAVGRMGAIDERYKAIMLTAYSRKAEALVRSMERIYRTILQSVKG
jgi:hypothetical protein